MDEPRGLLAPKPRGLVALKMRAEGKTLKEIGNAFGVSPTMARVLLYKTAKRMEAELSEDPIENARRLLLRDADNLERQAASWFGRASPNLDELKALRQGVAELRDAAKALPRPTYQYEQWPPNSFTHRVKRPVTPPSPSSATEEPHS